MESNGVSRFKTKTIHLISDHGSEVDVKRADRAARSVSLLLSFQVLEEHRDNGLQRRSGSCPLPKEHLLCSRAVGFWGWTDHSSSP